MNFKNIIWLILLCISSVQGTVVSDVTSNIGLMNVEGIIAAYGDFNSDRTTDVFYISNGVQLDLYLWHRKKMKFQKSGDATLNVGSDSKIVGVALADFNGDGSMDVLLSSKKITKNENSLLVEVYYGDKKKLVKGHLDAKMQDQPLIMDVNGDLLPDLFGTTDDNVRSYWVFVPQSGGNSGFRRHAQTGIYSTLIVPTSNAFVDVTGDMHADLLVKSKSDGDNELMFEKWEQTQGNQNFSLTDSFVIKISGAKLYGQLSYVDLDGDEQIDMLLPVCATDNCSESILYKHSFSDGKYDGNWSVVISNKNGDWKFPADEMKENTKNPFTFRYADIDNDGKIDGATVLRKTNGDRRFLSYFINAPCSQNKQSGCVGSRTFIVHELTVDATGIPIMISFFDVFENGVLDLMVTFQNKANADIFYTKVLRNEFNMDAAFVKVAVLSGRQSTVSYGANQVGATVTMTTTDTDGSEIHVKAPQLGQSAYFALQLPYVVLGLGRSPNFVDKVTVGLPKGPQTVDRVKSWAAIIPNSQVIVIPYPKDSPSEWVTKLLVTPSKLLLQTGGVLLGTCLFIAGIILILHIKEKKEDEKEKRKEAHKFHFDAL